jgi:hypothetical protein
MSAASVISGLAGVNACVVADKSGRVLEHTGASVDSAGVTGAVMNLASGLRGAGAMLGFGEAKVIVTRGSDCTWVAGSDSITTIAVRLVAGRSTTEVESVVGRGEWSTSIEWDVSDAELEYVPAADGPPASAAESLRPTRPAPSVLTPSGAPPYLPGASEPGSIRAGSTAETPTDTDSGVKWRTTPKYRAVMLNSPKGERIGTQSPSGKHLSWKRQVGPVPWDEGGGEEVTKNSGHVLSDSTPAFAGGLQTVGLPDLLEFLRFGQRTGTMACTSAAGAGKISMRSGRLIAASSPGTRPLPGYLVASGAATPEALNAIPEVASGAASLPGIAGLLVARGTCTTAQVRQALREQIRDAVAELLTWKNGEFAFDSDPSVDAVAPDENLEFDSQAVLLEILNHRDEASQASR